MLGCILTSRPRYTFVPGNYSSGGATLKAWPIRSLTAAVLTLCIICASQAAEPVTGPVRQGPRSINAAKHGVGQLIRDVTFTDITGKKHKLSDSKNKPLVIALTDTSCPISKKYIPTLAEIEDAYKDVGVNFLFVNLNEADKLSAIKEAIKTNKLTSPYVHDKTGQIGKALSAMTTTDVFVLDTARTLVYRGAVDDQYGFGYNKPRPTEHFLVQAIEAALANKQPKTRATWAPGCALALDEVKTKASDVTYHNRISRIVQNNCLQCHHQGGLGPFSLETYKDVMANKAMMNSVVKRGVMPPWFAAPGEIHFANDRSLPEADRADLFSWFKAGAPMGDKADAPLPRTFTNDWKIGKPDAVFTIPKPIAVKATGVMDYINVKVKTNFKETRWVQAMQVKPTARQVVHHVLILVEAPRDPATGKRGRRSSDGFFAAYVPGNDNRVFPEGTGKEIPAGATLHFQLHYTPIGKAAVDQTSFGVVFTKEKPANIVHTVGIANHRFKIPPHASNHSATAQIPVNFNVTLLGLFPHMHLRGKSFKYEVIAPGGKRKTILSVPQYDFNWQLGYYFAEPYQVPRGSKVVATGWFDNSKDNPANPNPKQTVRWGKQTDNEMMIGYVEFIITR
jgi:thiol-disulfide isomerase/thioredoxin